MLLPKSVRSVIIHCGMSNIDTSTSDKIGYGAVTITRFTSHCYPNIQLLMANGLDNVSETFKL